MIIKVYPAGNKDWKKCLKKSMYQFNKEAGLGFSLFFLTEEGAQRAQDVLNDI